MSPSATSSSSEPARRPPARGRADSLLAIAVLLVAAGRAEARVFITAGEALELAFPGARVERRTVYLTPDERARAAAAAGTDISSAVIHPYVAARGDTLAGTAYFDVHRVRTASETLMIVAGPSGEVVRIEVLAFDEPETYLAPRPWMDQFAGRVLDPDLRLRGGIRGIAGATLTARAATQAVRRVLAVHQVIAARGAAGAGAAAGKSAAPPESAAAEPGH